MNLCLPATDSVFRVALHGWDDDEGADSGAEDDANDDYNQDSPLIVGGDDDDALIGFTATHTASNIAPGSSVVHTTTSRDLRVTYRLAIHDSC